jgi:hypothetical protein
MNKVIIYFAAFMFDHIRCFSIVSAHERVSKDRYVEELLNHRVLVAGSS